MKSEVIFTVRVRLTILRLKCVDRMRAENLNARPIGRRPPDDLEKHRIDADPCKLKRLRDGSWGIGDRFGKIIRLRFDSSRPNLRAMNGYEVLRQLWLSLIETPILILSGEDDRISKLKGFGFGADDYLTKPFHREELVARI